MFPRIKITTCLSSPIFSPLLRKKSFKGDEPKTQMAASVTLWIESGSSWGSDHPGNQLVLPLWASRPRNEHFTPPGASIQCLVQAWIFCKLKYFSLLGKTMSKDTNCQREPRKSLTLLHSQEEAELLHLSHQSLIRDPNPFWKELSHSQAFNLPNNSPSD